MEAVAEREGLSVKQARRAPDEHLATATDVVPLDVGALFERAVRTELLALDRLEVLARSADNSSARGERQGSGCRSIGAAPFYGA